MKENKYTDSYIDEFAGKEGPISIDLGHCTKCNYVFSYSDICPACGNKSGFRSPFSLVNSDTVELLNMLRHFFVSGVEKLLVVFNEVIGVTRRFDGFTIRIEEFIDICDELFNKYPKEGSGVINFEYQDGDSIKIAPVPFQGYTSAYYDFTVVLILVFTFIESCFDNFVLGVMCDRGFKYSIAEKQIEMLRSWRDRGLAFLFLFGTDWREAINDVGFGDFYKTWEDLRNKKRNPFIHGKSRLNYRREDYLITKSDVYSSMRLALLTIDLFAELNNKYCIRKRA